MTKKPSPFWRYGINARMTTAEIVSFNPRPLDCSNTPTSQRLCDFTENLWNEGRPYRGAWCSDVTCHHQRRVGPRDSSAPRRHSVWGQVSHFQSSGPKLMQRRMPSGRPDPSARSQIDTLLRRWKDWAKPYGIDDIHFVTVMGANRAWNAIDNGFSGTITPNLPPVRPWVSRRPRSAGLINVACLCYR